MKRFKHSLSHYKLLTCSQGELVPIGLVEVLPGDTFQHATTLLARMNPLNSPVMHPVHCKIHHFFVPHRLVWNNGPDDSWESFITGGPDGMDASVFPTISLTNPAVGTLANYLGVPPATGTFSVSALPFRAYALVFNEYWRDQDLVNPLTIDITGGVDNTTNTTLQNAAWEKDYFTTCRPWEQKGPSISIPLAGDAPVRGTGDALGMTDGTTNYGAGYATGTAQRTVLYADQYGDPVATSGGGVGANPANNSILGVTLDAANSGMEAVLSGVTAVDMNDLRIAMALQRYEEARARYGSRYTEYLRYLGVRSSDARLQRPEYLGGGKQTIQFSEVLQTAPDIASGTSGADGVGRLLGHGIGAVRSNRYRRFFEEHGYVISFMVVRPITIYADGLPRTFNRRTKEDFWQYELQHVGQQAILNKEVRMAHATPEGTFGFNDRYDEYRRQESSIAGEMYTTFNTWHQARLFSSDPALNSTFVTANPTNRIYQDTANDQLIVMANHSIQARRLVSPVGNSYIF